MARVAPGQTAEVTKVVFWLLDYRGRVIEPHIEFHMEAETSKRTVAQRVYDKGEPLRKKYQVRLWMKRWMHI